jgi:hypothetical protein
MKGRVAGGRRSSRRVGKEAGQQDLHAQTLHLCKNPTSRLEMDRWKRDLVRWVLENRKMKIEI